MTYIGRFAPTPTGPLHFGSLVAAVASYLDAKANHGLWLLRIEDLDPPREDPRAAKLIQQQLIAHGLLWDKQVSLQSQHHARYEAVLEHLKKNNLIFPCNCSRKQLAHNNGLHMGRCNSDISQPHAWRLAMNDELTEFTDAVYGLNQQRPLSTVGDQVLKRKDGLYAYQLAVVVDDYDSGISHVVRGVDLLDNTARQLYLMNCLGFSMPKYLHLPLVVNADKQKLSKQNHAPALNLAHTQDNLRHALAFLNQPAPPSKAHSNEAILAFASEHWQPKNIQASYDGLNTCP